MYDTKQLKYDVAVIGGGPGGIPAAIAAARMGMKVVLVERNAFGRMEIYTGKVHVLNCTQKFHFHYGFWNMRRGFYHGINSLCPVKKAFEGQNIFCFLICVPDDI